MKCSEVKSSLQCPGRQMHEKTETNIYCECNLRIILLRWLGLYLISHSNSPLFPKFIFYLKGTSQ